MNQINTGNFFKRFKLAVYLLPLVVVCFTFTYAATDSVIHDYSNNYFPAFLVTEGIAPESVVFDILDFNEYVWSKGFSNELTDFYLNSPFIATLFYPLALIKNASYSKLIFNLFCISLFALTLKVFSRNHLKENEWPALLLIPLIFFIPLKNNLEFGQLYLLITSLTLLAYHFIIVRNRFVGELLLSLSIFIKIFPLFYCIPLIYQKKWRSILTVFILSTLLFCLSIFVGGWSFWATYLFDVLPNAILNESTVDYRSNAQSVEVFLKTIFVRDVYYNSQSAFNNVMAFKVTSVLVKSFVLASAITLSFKHKKQLFKVLSIWVVALFLTQPRTATYAQILWLIPAIEVARSGLSKKWKVAFLCILLLVCNFPFHWLRGGPIVFEFSRMWLSIALAFISFRCFNFNFNPTFLKAFLILCIPLLTMSFIKEVEPNSSVYVLKPNTHFMVHDFNSEDNVLVYNVLGKKGNESIRSTIKVESLDRTSCYISNNQVFYKKQQLTNNNAVKKKPALINGCDVYYLTDHHSRRGAFTIKKINVCSVNKTSL